MRWFPISVIIATGLHLVWAMGLFIDPSAKDATAVHALLLITDNTLYAAIILVIVATSGCVGAFLSIKHRVIRALLILPQQCVLIMSSTAAAAAMANRAFADGVTRPFWFITVDQAPILLITIGYLIALSRIVFGGEGRLDDR